MATKTEEDQDNRIDQGYKKGFDTGGTAYSLADLTKGEKSASAPADYSTENTLEAEQSPKEAYWSTKIDSKNGGKSKIGGKMSIGKRKGGLIALIVGLLGGGGLTIFFAPSLALVQFSEMLTSDVNDRLAALDIRSQHMFRAKLNDMTSGVCTGVQIKCRFTSMSKRQINKFSKAGFTVETSDTSFGRQRIVGLTAPDGTEFKNPAELRRALSSNNSVRSAMKRVYNPVYYSVSDKVANKVFGRFKTNKQTKISGSNVEERNQSLNNATAGDRALSGDGVRTDNNGRYVLDENNDKVYDSGDTASKFNEIQERNNAAVTDKPLTAGKAASSVLRSTGKGLMVTGAADTACTTYNTARAVGSAAKVLRSMQLAQFAMVILTTADSMKAGDATPEEVEYVANMLTQTDTREKIKNETSIVSDSALEDISEVDNPFYKKNAFDSPGYKIAAYNEAPVLSSQSLQYAVGGGLTGTFSSVMDTISNALGRPQNIRNTCGVVQSFWVRGAGLVAGLFVLAGTAGVGTIVSMGASAAAGLALPFLEAALADMLAGRVINESTVGVEAGDAAYAGTASLLGEMAKSSGMKPLNKQEAEEYFAATNQVKSDIAALEREEAKDNPFDITNQYSFLGSFTRSINPSVVKARTGASRTITSLGGIFSTAANTILPTTNAASQFNPERFERCEDEGYAELGIDADVFCNVRYGLSNAELSMDPIVALDYMLDNGYIDDTGNPKGHYKTFMESCVDRLDGWGEQGEEGGSIGTECFEKSNTKFGSSLKYFRVYTMDSAINDAMDGEEPVTPPNNSTSNSSNTATELPDGTAKEIATQIKSNSNITDATGQINQIVNGTRVNVSNKPLAVIAALGEKNKFTISSMKRDRALSVGAGQASLHLRGNAVDLSGRVGVNGVSISSYSAVHPTITAFLKEVATTIKGASYCEIGVPNATYVKTTKETGTKCSVFVDRGSAPHIHIGVR